MGCMLISGELGGIDSKQAIEYFERANYDKEYSAKADLEKGKIYFYGKGISPDYPKAMDSFQQAKSIPEGELLYYVSHERISIDESYVNDRRRESYKRDVSSYI